MKTILVCNQKGGVGKSLIADEIAFSFDRLNEPYNFFDMDGQGGVIHGTNEKPGAMVTIIDTPGALQPDLYKWIDIASLIIIPTKMTSRDIGPLQTMMELVSKQKVPVMYVLNGSNRFTASRTFEEWFSGVAGKSKVLKLPQSEQFAQAAAFNQSVINYAPRSSAAAATMELITEIRKILKLQQETF